MKEGIFTGIPNEEYHADRTAISSTWLKVVDKQTPYHLRSYLDSPPAAPSDALVMGSAVDCLVFEPELWDRRFIVAPEINRRTNAGKELWASLLNDAVQSKREVVNHKMHAEALVTAEAIRRNPVMADYLRRDCVSQQVIVWRDPVTGLLCKCKSDLYLADDGTLLDLKTARNAAPDEFAKAIANFGYHIQAAFYTDGYITAGLPVSRFVFGVMEKPDNRNTHEASPNLMAFYELDPADMKAGQDSYTSSLSAINFCMINDEWSGYTDHVMPIRRPPWARKHNVEQVTAL